MKHHYILVAVMRHDYLCSMGAICTEEELNEILKPRGVKRYRIKVIDDEPVAGWENADWTPIK